MKKSILLTLLVLLTLSFQSAPKSRNFSSPKAVVETFIKAAGKKKKKVLSSCFSERSPGEWDEIRNETLSKSDLNGLKKFVSGAVVSKVEMKGENDAIVFVTFKTREEKIHTVKEGNRWLIMDF